MYIFDLYNSFQLLFPQFSPAFYEKASLFVCFKPSTCNLQMKEKEGVSTGGRQRQAKPFS